MLGLIILARAPRGGRGTSFSRSTSYSPEFWPHRGSRAEQAPIVRGGSFQRLQRLEEGGVSTLLDGGVVSRRSVSRVSGPIPILWEMKHQDGPCWSVIRRTT